MGVQRVISALLAASLLSVSSMNAQLAQEWMTIDSLKQSLRQAGHDSTRARLCDDISFEFYSIHIDSVLFYANLSQQYARQSNHLPLLAQSYNSQGVVYFSKAEFIDALGAFQEANRIYNELNDRANEAKMINNLGLIFAQMRDFNRANERLETSYSMSKELGEWYLASHALYNIAGNYFEMGDIPAAWEHTRELESLRKEHPLEATSADALFGDLYNHENQLDSAIQRYQIAIAFYETRHDLFQSSATRASLAEALVKAKRFTEAWTQSSIAQKIIEENEFTDLLIQIYQVQASLHHASGQEGKAFELEHMAFNLADSIQKRQQIGIVNDMYNQFESSQVNQELERKNLQLQNRTIWIISVIAFALLCAGTAFLLYRLSRRTSRLNTLLRQKNREISNQRQSIIASISYAKHIQESVLTRPDVLAQSFAKSVFVNRPRDIISGDFFTYQYVNNRHYLAVVDCTGHGVPGAFISVIVNARLRKVLHELKERDPARIIDRLNEEIRIALHQEAGDLSSMDGVEISICSIQPEKHIIEYSGAGAPMLLIQSGSEGWKEMKAYSSPLGGPQQLWNRETEKNGLQSHKIEYHPGDWLFLFSDGMQDQLGGKEWKKLNKTPFYQILHDAAGSEDATQRIEEQLENWMGTHQQTDDIIVVGVQL